MSRDYVSVIVVCFVITLLTLSLYTAFDFDKPPLPDANLHTMTGEIKKVDGVWYKFSKITFEDGREEWFYGRGIWDITMNLNWNANYTFYWKWSHFERECSPGYSIGKWCYKIKNNDSDYIVWRA